MRYVTSVLLVLLLAACTSNARRIDRMAETAGLDRLVVNAQGFPTLIYMKRGTVGPDGSYPIFLEGDGRPWRNGTEPNDDPTPRNPLALNLLLETAGPSAYVARPCYHRLYTERCTPAQWTSARYSEEIVSSMTDAVRQVGQKVSARKLVLVGYSGGGALAVLIAERLDSVSAVITISANLDIDTWTSQHRYLPLTESLNPAESQYAHPWREIHLHGSRDTVVPPGTTAAYFARYPAAKNMLLDDFDHICCWVARWPDLFDSLSKELE